MAFALDKVVPWGRSYDEYVAMFALSERDLAGRILGCGDGPAGFNSVLTKRGGRAVSVDPIYRFSAGQIRSRILQTCDEVLRQTRKNRRDYVWRNIPSIEELRRVRMAAMEEFLQDFPAGRRRGRYVEGTLPALPFRDGEFDIALCSHFLFLYSALFSEDFHVQSIREMCRVAGEARIFPLLELSAVQSRHVENVIARLEEEGLAAGIEAVPYEFQKGGDRMLKASNRSARGGERSRESPRHAGYNSRS
jgi:hypothetical protein